MKNFHDYLEAINDKDPINIINKYITDEDELFAIATGAYESVNKDDIFSGLPSEEPELKQAVMKLVDNVEVIYSDEWNAEKVEKIDFEKLINKKLFLINHYESKSIVASQYDLTKINTPDGDSVELIDIHDAEEMIGEFD